MLAYPKGLEAVNTSEWDGWVQSPAGTGSAIYSVDNVDSYLYVHPKAGAAAAEGSDGGSSSATVYVVVAIAVVVIAAIALVLLRRGRRQVEE